MPKIINDNGIILDCTFELGKDQNKHGLILHSRSGRNNSQYNDGLEIILNRLKKLGFTFVDIFIISNELIKIFTQKQRQILIDNQSIFLNVDDINKLRKKIGSVQKDIKTNPKTKGGNPTKKILLFHPEINNKMWSNIANNTFQHIDNQTFESLYNSFEIEVELFLKQNIIEKPFGKNNPKKQSVSTLYYERDPKVKAWVLKNSNGKCGLCKKQAPFLNKNNIPYLEVHHIKSLSEGGEDTIENTIAVCPNCHRALHFSKDKKLLIKQIKDEFTN